MKTLNKILIFFFDQSYQYFFIHILDQIDIYSFLFKDSKFFIKFSLLLKSYR